MNLISQNLVSPNYHDFSLPMPESVLFGCVSRTLFSVFRVLRLAFEFWLAVLRLCELSLLLFGLFVFRLVACRTAAGRLTASEPTARLLELAVVGSSGRAAEFMAVLSVGHQVDNHRSTAGHLKIILGLVRFVWFGRWSPERRSGGLSSRGVFKHERLRFFRFLQLTEADSH